MKRASKGPQNPLASMFTAFAANAAEYATPVTPKRRRGTASSKGYKFWYSRKEIGASKRIFDAARRAGSPITRKEARAEAKRRVYV
ncbi:MAG TPA: hypothetical protein VF183_10900 [Acidimicrobiales bacterium]